MKELIQIIESLHNINKTVIEKDNFINNHTDIIELVTQLIHDEQFIKSDIYLDLRVKYILPIEDKLNKMKESKITIEPEFIPPKISPNNTNSKSNENKSVNNFAVTAPIKTDIYLAPNTRPKFTKKKVTKNQQSEKTQKKNIDVQLDEDEDEHQGYIEFEYKDQTYYIDSQPLSNADSPLTFQIFKFNNGKLQIVGNLKGPSITLLNHEDSSKCENIKLDTVNAIDVSSQNDKILTNYTIM